MSQVRQELDLALKFGLSPNSSQIITIQAKCEPACRQAGIFGAVVLLRRQITEHFNEEIGQSHLMTWLCQVLKWQERKS